MRTIAAAFVLGALLAACGTITVVQASRDWLSQSDFAHARTVLIGDVRHAESALRNTGSSAAALHTVCAVLLIDSESANASLPSPDNQANTLLAATYASMGAGANTCYVANASVTLRTRALGYLRESLAQLSFAFIRLHVASGQ